MNMPRLCWILWEAPVTFVWLMKRRRLISTFILIFLLLKSSSVLFQRHCIQRLKGTRVNYTPDPNHPLSLAHPYFPETEVALLQQEFQDILRGKLSMGPRTHTFEENFSAFCETSFPIAFPSCTSPLE